MSATPTPAQTRYESERQLARDLYDHGQVSLSFENALGVIETLQRQIAKVNIYSQKMIKQPMDNPFVILSVRARALANLCQCIARQHDYTPRVTCPAPTTPTPPAEEAPLDLDAEALRDLPTEELRRLSAAYARLFGTLLQEREQAPEASVTPAPAQSVEVASDAG